MGFDEHTIHHHISRASRVRWELVRRIKCSKPRTGIRRWARGFASRLVGLLDVVSVIEDCHNLESVGVRLILFLSSRLGSTIICTACRVRASIDAYLWIGVSSPSPGLAF